MRIVKILWSIVTATISLLTVLQHIALVLPENPKEWNSFERLLDGMLKADYWIWILSVLIILLVVLTVADIVISVAKRHRFKVQSFRFRRFFTKWYSQLGKLIIICDDIDWTCTQNSESIFQALEKKCDEGLKLYLGKGYNSDLVNLLRDKGAEVFHAKES